MLQQHLPFTVLKLNVGKYVNKSSVATTPTVYGIETIFNTRISIGIDYDVATTPTVYGIETVMLKTSLMSSTSRCNNTYRLRY